MDRPASCPSIWKPVIILFCLALVSYLIYYGSRLIPVQGIHQPLAATFGTIYFVAIFFGALYVYTDCYVRDVPLGMRIVASSLVPFVWMTKDVVVMMGAHPIIESLYWYLNPLSIWVICLLSVEMGVGTLIGRVILERRGREIKIVTVGPIAAIILGAAAFGGIFAWGQGENLYVLFLDVYRRIFSGT